MSYAGNRTCRLCLENSAPDDLIKPCSCSGSLEFVHRTCLNQWRAVSPRESSFLQCDICHANYQIVEVQEEVPCWRVKFMALVTRDILAVLIALNVLLLVVGAIAYVIFRPSDEFLNRFRATRWMEAHWKKRTTVFFLSYALGGAIVFFCVGLAALSYGFFMLIDNLCGSGEAAEDCCGGNRRSATRDPNAPPSYEEATAYPYRRARSSWSCSGCYWVYCGPSYYNDPYVATCDCCCCCYDSYTPRSSPSRTSSNNGDCNCSGGNCNGGDCKCGDCKSGDCKGDGGAVLVVLLIVVIAIIILGIVVAVFLFSMLVTKIIQRHMNVVHRRFRARMSYVRDLNRPHDVPRTLDAMPALSRLPDDGVATKEQVALLTAAPPPPSYV